MKLKDITNVYCIGIKGAGVAAVAQILHARSKRVSGSDTGEKFFTDELLKKNGIPYFETFSPANIPDDVDVIVYSTAYSSENNVEMAEAVRRGVPMLSYPQMLGELFREKMGIAVAGSHGKTTTSALLAHVLDECGQHVDAIIGSQVVNWKSSILAGGGDYMVAEADEYQNKLASYDPWAVLLTSVDWDHPDYFPTVESYKNVFKDFVERISKTGFLVVWGDSADTLDVSTYAHCDVLTYGFGEDCMYRIDDVAISESGGQSFRVLCGEKTLGEFSMKLIGKHNVLNAAAVIAACHRMQLDLDLVKKALETFAGTIRRFERIGNFKGALLIDDYAHHPEEIKATLEGARSHFPDKEIVVVFHPHTFTRTKALLQEFAQSFDDADKVIVIDIYGSAREQQGGVSSEDLVGLINRYTFGKADYIPTINETVEYLKQTLNERSMLITMGAGDVWKISHQLKQ